MAAIRVECDLTPNARCWHSARLQKTAKGTPSLERMETSCTSPQSRPTRLADMGSDRMGICSYFRPGEPLRIRRKDIQAPVKGHQLAQVSDPLARGETNQQQHMR